VDIGAAALAESSDETFQPALRECVSCARVDTANPDGSRATVLFEKLVPELEYLAGDIALSFRNRPWLAKTE